MSAERRCFVCERIDMKQFYRELREFGFNAEQAQKTITLVEEVYRTKPSLLCGKRRNTIKATFAYIGVILFNMKKPRIWHYHNYLGEHAAERLFRVTQWECKDKWNISHEGTIRRLYQQILSTISIEIKL